MNALETPALHHRLMRQGPSGGVRRIIAEAAAGAGDGADALRKAGVAVELEGYTVEVVVDPDEPNPAASVKLVFRRPGR